MGFGGSQFDVIAYGSQWPASTISGFVIIFPNFEAATYWGIPQFRIVGDSPRSHVKVPEGKVHHMVILGKVSLELCQA